MSYNFPLKRNRYKDIDQDTLVLNLVHVIMVLSIMWTYAHQGDVKWWLSYLKSQATRLFDRNFAQVCRKANTKAELCISDPVGFHWQRSSNAETLYPDNKIHGANMGPTWVLSAPDGPHVGPLYLAIRVFMSWHQSAHISLLLHYWPFVMGIHHSSFIPLIKGQMSSHCYSKTCLYRPPL